jgi:hydroxymethylbilane synthase
MPAVLPEGLAIGAVLPREDARDAMVLPLSAGHPETLEELIAQLGREPRIGTSSVRRTAQLIRLFPGAAFAPIRGNLGTRLRKVDSGEFDAIVLAAAGLHRLDQRQRVSALLPVDACVPAPGQGIIAIEIRQNDAPVRELLSTIDDHAAAQAFVAERAVVTRLGGGCQMPIGAYAAITGDMMEMTAVVLAPDGDRAVRSVTRGPAAAAEKIGHAAADELLEQGAAEILADIGGDAAVKGLQP